MMRDVSARFKYSEREFQAQHKSGESSSGDGMEKKPPSTPSQIARSTGDEACPSRELIHSHIQRFYRNVDSAAEVTTDWEVVSARICRDLAPYTVLKLGGFSLGDSCTRLLGDVLSHDACKLRTLDLGFNRLTDEGASRLAIALTTNASLENLYLSGNDIGPTGAQALAQALTKNTHLRSLHLSGNNIGEEGARFLADGIAGNTALQALYLGTNGIGTAGMQSLATALTHNKSLEELTLGQNKVGSAGVLHLAAAFATGQVVLSTLELGKNGVDQEGAIGLARSLCGTNHLQNLYMDHNPLGDVGASAFGALLAQNTELRVLDLSYTQMSLLGLRELSVVGLARSRILLCLLLDGHDWASTQYMKKNQHPSLNGASLATKGANNYAASCIVGAINANVHSVLFKLTGVDLSLAVAMPTSSTIENRRSSDTLSRNEMVLRGLRDARGTTPSAATASGIPPSHKRKPTEDTVLTTADRMPAGGTDLGADCDVGDGSSPLVPQPKFQKLEGNIKAGSSSGSICSVSGSCSRTESANALLGLLPSPHNGSGNGASNSAGGSEGNSPSKTSSNRPPRVIRIPSRGSAGRLPRSNGSCEKRLSLKSPRYESTMELHIRKVIFDIAKLPFNADEFKTLQAYYLGGQCSIGANGCGNLVSEDVTSELTSCAASHSSRMARYRRTMALINRLEASKQATDVVLLMLLRQLHYLVGAFKNTKNAAQTIDEILVSVHEEMDELNIFSNVALLSHKPAT
ncbi:hypothetical protein CCR75_009168 [Bremia lactucae]|uniref:Uncharacterized protein n=1 Tax=Bremia lactucae TaxID=4779 RepID=A0A976IG14_BRELC|nr:hypothetical protein CCR75_009168 [Bremia lactucae]